MDDIWEILAENEQEEEHIPDESINKRIGEKIAELDSLLVDIHASAAIEERGLSSLLRQLVPTCYFLRFLLVERSAENLLFYLEVEHYRKKILTHPDPEQWRGYAKQMYDAYICANAPLEINIISPVRDAVKQALSPETLEAGEEGLWMVFDACYRACFALMMDTWKRFVGSQDYSAMMVKLRTLSLNDNETKKEAIRQVLAFFKDSPDLPLGSDLDFLGGGNGADLIKEKTVEFLRRSNVYNVKELDPGHILENWDEGKPHIVRATADYVPNAYDNSALAFNKGDLILVEDTSGNGTWKGRKNGTGFLGVFPSTLVEPTSLTLQSPKMGSASATDSDELKSLLPRLFKSVVQSCCQIIHTAQPPVGSWVLDGLVGAIIAVMQIVGTSDSVGQRVFTQKDVRWLHHCSAQVIKHLATLIETIHKAYVTSDTRSRSSNPNYLSATSTDKILGVMTDMIRSVKELAIAATPIINGLLATPSQNNVGLLVKVLSDRATIVDLRRSLDQSQTFLTKSIGHMRRALEHPEDVAYLMRANTLVLTASLQIVEAVSGLSQLDQTITPTTIDAITSISRNGSGIYDVTLRILAEQIAKTSPKESISKSERLIAQLEKNLSVLSDELSKMHFADEISVPESGAEHSDTQPVEALTKDLVGGIFEFLRAVNEGRKSELMFLVDSVSDHATKLGNKIVFELKNIGVSGIKRMDELKSDGWDLVAGKAALSKAFSALVVDNKQEDLGQLMRNNVKDLAQSVLALIPGGEIETDVAKRKRAMENATQAVRVINNLSYRVSDLTSNPEIRTEVKNSNSTLAVAIQRFEMCVRDVSGLIPSTDSVNELKGACTFLLATTKQLSTVVYAAIAEPGFGGDQEEADEETTSTTAPLSIASPFDNRKPASPFDPLPKRGPLSPFDNSRASVVASPPQQRNRMTRVMDVKRSSAAPDSFNPIKTELNIQLTVIVENISKLKNDATLAAGVWPPPQVIDDAKTHCQAIAKAIKALLAAFESLTTGERDRKEKELAQQIGQWKSYRLQIHGQLITLTQELLKHQERRQADDLEERKQYQIKKQEKHQTPSKVWIEKSANVDYEKWHKGFCTEEVLRDSNEDVELDSSCDRNDPKPANVKGGSLYGLVRMLTFYKYPDPDYTHAFLMSYRSFTTPDELLSLIIERYNVSPPEEVTHAKQLEYYYVKKIVPIRMRVFNVIRTWLEDHFEDFAENDSILLKQLNEFMDSQMSVTDDNLALLLKKTITKKLEGKQQVKVKSAMNPPETIFCDKWFGTLTKITDISPLEIARQLTLIDFKVFSSIQPTEFLNQSWSKEALKSRAPNLRAMIKRSNDLTYFVATELLTTEDLEERQKKLVHFITIAEKCYELNSFNCVLGIYSGLTSSPIHRLKKTWAILEAKEYQGVGNAMKKLENFTDSSNNHSNYRNTLHSINPPCVPFLGQYLTDLVFIDDGNPDTIQVGDKAFINFQKRMQTASVIREVNQFQQTPYNLADWSELIKYLLRNNNLMDDSQLYKQSLKVEPRAKA